ncbi:MAG: ABC transporter permease [Verrucomicrobiae bacterium]|nr:ABC transporter permease [Verrucomicrobiae bacterium]MDW8309865.1 ABC transporter permease [Verrucomicrobiales bacterium]
MDSAPAISGLMSSDEQVLRPRRGLVAIDFGELWRFRELFWLLAWRNVLIRYKQAYLGVGWAVLQPLLTMAVFTVVFGKLAGMSSGGAPFAVFNFAALLPWMFFANALSESSNSLVASQNLITKVYFPRLLIPTSAVLSGALDFLISIGLLLLLMAWYGVAFTANLLLMPVFFGLTFLAALAAGLWFSALNVRYRDVKYIVPFIVRLGIYVSPVGFLSAKGYEFLGPAYGLNPLVGLIDGFRWSILGAGFEPYWPGFWLGQAVVAVLLVSGAYYFRTMEKTFADVI